MLGNVSAAVDTACMQLVARSGAARFVVSAIAVMLALTGCASTNPEEQQSFGVDAGAWASIEPGPLSARRDALGLSVRDVFLVLGGWDSPACPPNADCTAPEDPALRDGALFDPATGAWKKIADAPVPVSGHDAVVIDETVYLLTPELGRTDSPASFLSYNLTTDAWNELPAPPPGWGALVAAGEQLFRVANSDEYEPAVDSVFDPLSAQWRDLPADPLGPSFDREAIWIGDRLLLTAKDLVPSPGSDEPAVVRLATFDPRAATWELIPVTEVIGWTPTFVNGLVVFPSLGYADGGEVNNWGKEYPFGGIVDPTDWSFTALPGSSDDQRGAIRTGAVVGQKVIVSDFLLDPVTGATTPIPALPEERLLERTIVGGTDSLFVWGGSSESGNTSSGYLLRF